MAEIRFAGAVVYRLGGITGVKTEGRTLGSVLSNLESRYPVLKGTLIREGRLSPLYLIYVDDCDARKVGLEMTVTEGSEIRIMNALTGG